MGVREKMGGDRTDETQSLVWYDMPSVYKYEIDAKFENLGYFTSKAGLCCPKTWHCWYHQVYNLELRGTALLPTG